MPGTMKGRWPTRFVLAVIVVASLVPSALLVQLAWWRTTDSVSRKLLDALETQITDAARRAWWGRVLEVQAVATTLREGLATAGTSGRERALVTAAGATSTLSWVVLAAADGEVLAVRHDPPERPRLHRGASGSRVSPTRGTAPDPAETAEGSILDEPWVAEARGWSEPGWVEVPAAPDGGERAVAYVDASRGEVLAAMIGFSRFAKILGAIPVGATGRAYVLGPDGAIVLAAQAQERPRRTELDAVALAAGGRVALRSEADLNRTETIRLVVGGERYAVGLSPLWFKGWQLAAIVPEAEFLGEVGQTLRQVAVGLALAVAVAAALAAFAAQRLVARPIGALVGKLGAIERFELDRLAHRPSHLAEVDQLSRAIERMGAGLADFGKFIPTDLVRTLLAEGMRLEPGGTRRELTVLFADLAGFTALSEGLGDRVVPIVSRFLEEAASAVAAEGGTVDKFIGDAVMAFWNAPSADPDHARHACRAALSIAACLERLDLPPDVVGTLKVRVGLHTGPAIVGNIGSPTRLNYTALGDTVNLASRLEAVNKVYGTRVLASEATVAAAGPRLLAREIDTVAVFGRMAAVRLFELLPGEGPCTGIEAYEAALALYRDRRFSEAVRRLDDLLVLRPDDSAARVLAARCVDLLRHPPGPDWRPLTVLGEK